MKRSAPAFFMLLALPLFITACGDNEDSSTTTTAAATSPGAAASAGSWDQQGQPVNGGPTGADGSTGNNLTHDYCAKNENPGCPAGSYVGANAIPDPAGSPGYVKCEGSICTNPNHGAGDTAPGMWDANGNPINGGPTGADGSTGNNVTADYCRTNQDPACPVGSSG